MSKNLKTTIAGALNFLVVVFNQALTLFDADPATNPDVGAIIAAAILLYGLIKAADA